MVTGTHNRSQAQDVSNMMGSWGGGAKEISTSLIIQTKYFSILKMYSFGINILKCLVYTKVQDWTITG